MFNTYPILSQEIYNAYTTLYELAKAHVPAEQFKQILIAHRHIESSLTSAKTWHAEARKHIGFARKDYAEPSDNDLEIDDVPMISPSDEGVWVSAWVWVCHTSVMTNDSCLPFEGEIQ